MEYKDTINLPSTGFKMKASLGTLEPAMMKKWKEEKVYEKIVQRTGETFMLHDGPPYANGQIHIGHALNKLLKDIIVRSKAMSGYRTPYVPGWDCHGLPIEHQVSKKLGSKKRDLTINEVRTLCREYAEKFIEIQREEFKRLGVTGNWDEPYLTMNYHYEADIIRSFGKLVGKDLVYKGKKPVFWCPSCETALAEAEVEYAEHRSMSVYVKFPVTDDKGLLNRCDKPVYFVIWTTTPWTLVSNLAICLNPAFSYDVYSDGNESLVMASDLAETCLSLFELSGYEKKATLKGDELEGIVCRHPFIERDSIVINGMHVTLEAGTGCVHTAPGHGQEDYEVGLKYGLEVYAPVSSSGRFTESEFKDIHVFEANSHIKDKLAHQGMLLGEDLLEHSYPHCWRCKKPVIFRATEQWFVSIDKNDLRKNALNAINSVDWIPKWGRERIYNMIENRPDWCISRQRSWGVPITVFYCKSCEHPLLSEQIIESVAEKVERHGADIWFSDDPLLPADTACEKCSNTTFRKETDILDVWFDSGVSSLSVLKEANEKWPADLYLEGSDQHRGWFHSSLLLALGITGEAPYRSVLTHGFVVDGKGRKMSKSAGNIISPQKVVARYGAETLRLWVAAEDYRDEVKVSDDILSQFADAYRKIRNTARFILGNISDFVPEKDTVSYEQLLEIDKLELHRLQKIVKKVKQSYRDYQFHQVFHTVNNYCTVELSSFYLDILKDRLYTFGMASIKRRSGQTVLLEIVKAIAQLTAPIIAFTSDEIWGHIPHFEGKQSSVHLSCFPDEDERYLDEELDKKWRQIENVRQEVSAALELRRAQKVIGNSLEAELLLYTPSSLYNFLKECEDELSTIFIVSSVKVLQGKPDATSKDESQPFISSGIQGLEILVGKACGAKCERCWNYSESVGSDSRHPEICDRCLSVILEMQKQVKL